MKYPTHVNINQRIELALAVEADFDQFRKLRKEVMREHVDRQGLGWDESFEDAYHRALFDEGGLYKILVDGACVGFVGLLIRHDSVILGRFCIDRTKQSQGIGSKIIECVTSEPIFKGLKIEIEVLIMNPARKLFERHGFNLVREDDKMAYYCKI